MGSNFKIQSINNVEERILRENVLVNFNMNVNERNRWGEENVLACDTFTIVLPLDYVGINASIKDIDNAFFSGKNQITIENDEMKIEIFTAETRFSNSIKDVLEEVEGTFRHVNNTLDSFGIKDFKLICDFYIWVN